MWAAPDFAALERRLEGGPRGEGGGHEVEGVREILVTGEDEVDADVLRALLGRGQLRRSRAQVLLVAHHARVLGHGGADGALEGADALRTVRGEQAVDLRAGHGGRRPRLRGQAL
ncbi:hypothetical protein GCM10027073_13500 [Streptomyces chlorus]